MAKTDLEGTQRPGKNPNYQRSGVKKQLEMAKTYLKKRFWKELRDQELKDLLSGKNQTIKWDEILEFFIRKKWIFFLKSLKKITKFGMVSNYFYILFTGNLSLAVKAAARHSLGHWRWRNLSVSLELSLSRERQSTRRGDQAKRVATGLRLLLEVFRLVLRNAGII